MWCVQRYRIENISPLKIARKPIDEFTLGQSSGGFRTAPFVTTLTASNSDLSRRYAGSTLW